jgi:DNA-directed RNA polymerase I and III subunit RPAC2
MSVNEVRLKTAAEPLKIMGTGPPTCRTIVLGDEDHTLGNALRHVLLASDANVTFAGYSVPHPSEPVVHIRVQTTPQTTAIDAFTTSCSTVKEQCDILLEQLESKLPYVKDDRIRMEQILLEEGYDDGQDDDEEEFGNNHEIKEEVDETEIREPRM